MAIYAFYKRRRNHMPLISGHNGGQYLRLMAISTAEMLGTVPLGTFYIVVNARSGVTPWKGWASMHSHYSEVEQVADFTWKNVPEVAIPLEMFRWSLVACAFVFFALFGLAVEAREQYYRLYRLLARRICTSSSSPHGAPHAYVVRSLCCHRPDSSGLIFFFIFAVPHQSLV
jgi:pheromone a factor receptor